MNFLMKMLSKRVITLVLLLLCYTQGVFAQNQFKDSVQLKEYWAKRGAAMLVYAYMEDQQNLSEKEQMGKKIFYNIFLNNEISDEAVSYFLREFNWANTDSMVYRPIVSRMYRDFILDRSFFNIKAANGDLYRSENWSNTVDNILKNYRNALQEILSTNNLYEEEPVSTSEKSIFERLSFILPSFLLGFILGVFFIKYNKKNTNPKTIKKDNDFWNASIKPNRRDEEDTTLERHPVENEEGSPQSKEDSKFEVINQQDKVVSSPQIEEIEDNEGVGNMVTEEKTYETTYFTMPEVDGSFQIQNGESYYDGKKYFKIIREQSAKVGELHYLSSERDKRAINRFEAYLMPVGEIEDLSFVAEATQVEMLSPGKVLLENEKWIIDPKHKLKLKFC